MSEMDSVPERPDSDQVSADEQRIGALLRAVAAPAPAALQYRIAALNVDRSARRRRSIARPRAFGFGFAGAFAAAVAVVVVLLVGSATAPPTAFAAAQQAALAKPTAAAPRSLVAAGTTIAFPRWSARGWPSIGTRSDRLGGRTVTTEFYSSYENGSLGYSIVSGAPLRLGARGHTVTHSGSNYWVIRVGGAQIVAWVQAGHTCVVASRTAQADTLLKLAFGQDGASRV